MNKFTKLEKPNKSEIDVLGLIFKIPTVVFMMMMTNIWGRVLVLADGVYLKVIFQWAALAI